MSFQTPLGDGTEQFHIVVSALGYGYEREIATSDSKSYWWPDHIANYSQERHEYGTHAKLVSGTGDGGLIDCIRFAQAPKTNLNQNIALEITAFARRSEFKTLDIPISADIEDKLSELEETIFKLFTDHFKDFPPYTGAITGVELTKLQNAEEKLKIAILSEFKGLFDDQKFSNQFVKGEKLRRIGLIARGGQLFTKTSSIVNQILIAFLWGRHHDIIIRGAKVVDGKLVDCPAGAKQFVDVDKSVLVLRHGASSKLKELSGDAASAETVNRSGQDSVIFENSSELDALRSKLIGLRGGKNDKTIPKLTQEFAARYFSDATPLFNINSENNIDITISLPNSDVNDDVYRKLGGFDRLIFGSHVRYLKGNLDDFKFGSYDD